MRAQSGIEVKARFGRVPNAMATFANSPVALDGFLELSKIVNQGRLNTRQRELLALAIAQENECQYCLSSHTAFAARAGLSPASIRSARAAQSDNPFDEALVSFAMKAIQHRGAVPEEDLKSARESGIDNGLMREIIAVIALGTLTNYANRIADTDIDFPAVQVQL
jgi:uncharacterized peroxidase-related enzyme